MAVDDVIVQPARLGATPRRSCVASEEEDKVIVRHAISSAGMTFVLFGVAAHAGPCTDRIYQTDLAVAKLLNVAAAQGRPAAQSTFATMHRQPTPSTVASAEAKAGDLSPADFEAITKDMDEARNADDAGDRDGCEKALVAVDQILNHSPAQ
jgi:hypothetical protein